MKLLKLAFLASAMIAASNAATVNIQISQGSNQATNFANHDGTQNNGLVWGLMISTSDTQFSPLYTGFQLGTSLDGTRVGDTDDYFIASTVGTIQGTTTDIANPGKITVMLSIQMDNLAINPIATGNQFALIWFDSNVTSPNQALASGTWYGIMTNPAWTIPAAGATQNVANFFSGSPDPEKRADDILVPEPSSVLLGLMGLLVAFRRRR